MKNGTILAAAAAFGMAGSAMAGGLGYSTVNGLGNTGSGTHRGILEQVYGGGAFNFVDLGGGVFSDRDFTNGTITATRVADTDGGGIGSTLMIHQGSDGTTTTDQVWQDGVVSVMAEAKYASFSQSFGWDSTPGGLIELNGRVNVTENGGPDDVTGDALFSDLAGGNEFSWTREGNTGNFQSARQGDNFEGNDYMVTYEISGTGDNEGRPIYLVFFEDTNSGDFDYNDLVFEIRAIPVPPAALLGLAGLVGAGVLRRRMK